MNPEFGLEIPTSRTEQYTVVLNGLCRIAESYFYAGRIDDSVHVLTAGEQLADGSDVQPRDLAALLICSGYIHAWRGSLITGEYDIPFAILNRAVQVAKATRDEKLLARALDTLGVTCYNHAMTLADADFDTALSHFQQALTLRETAHDQRGICESLFNIGLVAERKRQYDEALTAFTTVYSTAKQQNYKSEMAGAARHLGFAHIRAGNLDQALDCFQEAQLLIEETGQKIFLPFAQLSVGEVFHMQHKWKQAQQYYQMAYEIAQKMQIKRASVQIAYSLGEVYEEQSNVDQAYAYYEIAYNLATAINFQLGITLCGAKLQSRTQ